MSLAAPAPRERDPQRRCDSAFWRPRIAAVARRHGLGCHAIRPPARRGIHPVFIVDDLWVVKFLPAEMEGAAAFAVEMAMNRAIAAGGRIPAPAVIASGEGPLAHIVFERVPGTTWSDAFAEVTPANRERIARRLGEILRRLHALPAEALAGTGRSLEFYRAWLQDQREGCAARLRRRGSLPAHLIAQIDEFLPPLESSTRPGSPPGLLHGDLHANHLLGRGDGRDWALAGIIDFGHGMVGDPLYDLLEIHLDVFRCDKRLLAAFFDGYGREIVARRELPRRALSLALLSPFDPLAAVSRYHPGVLADIPTLADLAAWLWEP
jgi:hygromycin-B 7''-O-kinase